MGAHKPERPFPEGWFAQDAEGAQRDVVRVPQGGRHQVQRAYWPTRLDSAMSVRPLRRHRAMTCMMMS